MIITFTANDPKDAELIDDVAYFYENKSNPIPRLAGESDEVFVKRAAVAMFLSHVKQGRVMKTRITNADTVQAAKDYADEYNVTIQGA